MERIKISDFAEVITGGTPSTTKKEYWDNGTIPWLQSGVCQNCDVNNCDTFITELGLQNSSAKLMPKDTVLIALTGSTTGKVAYLNFEACANQSVTGILPNKKFRQRYIYYYLLSKREKILFDSYGGAQKHISQGYVKNMEIPIKTLDEQDIIINNLSIINNAIELKKQQLVELDNLIKSQFVEINNNLSDYKTCPIGDIYKFQYGKGNNIPESKGIYPCYGSNGQVGFHTEYNNEDAPIIGHIGAYAGIVVWAPGKHFVTYNGVMCFLKDYSLVNPKYGYYLLKNQDFLNNSRRGGAQPFVSYDMLEAPIVNIPPIELQNQFAEFADHIDKLEFVKIMKRDSATRLEYVEKFV